jgi:hypothetical protein
VFLSAAIYDPALGAAFTLLYVWAFDLMGIRDEAPEGGFIPLLGSFVLVLGIAYVLIYRGALQRNGDLILVGTIYKFGYAWAASRDPVNPHANVTTRVLETEEPLEGDDLKHLGEAHGRTQGRCVAYARTPPGTPLPHQLQIVAYETIWVDSLHRFMGGCGPLTFATRKLSSLPPGLESPFVSKSCLSVTVP